MNTATKSNNRIEWADFGKFICIYFVMLSHWSFVPDWLQDFYKPFFLTLFFFFSGYFHKTNLTFGKFILKKVKGLLVPWFSFSIIIILLSSILTFSEHKDPVEELLLNFIQIGDNSRTVAYMWFIACLFVAFIPFYFIAQRLDSLNKNSVALFFCITFVISLIGRLYIFLTPGNIFPWKSNNLPWHTEKAMYYLIYMAAGFCFRKYIEPEFEKHVKIKNLILAILIYLSIVIFNGFILKDLKVVNNDRIYVGILVAKVAITYVSSFFGIYMCILFSKLATPTKFTSFVGANTLIYYALHVKLLSLIEKIMTNANVLELVKNNALIGFLACLVLTIVVAVLLIVPAIIINRWFPFLLGKWYPKKKIAE